VRPLAGLLVLTVTLGAAARAWDTPSRLLVSGDPWTVAAIGAAASVIVNNLPAAVLLSAQPLPDPQALLLGLDIGPNLAVTGSLSALLWLQSARTVDADPSIGTYSRLGLLLAPLSLALALTTLL
jgi:arsenical pump membrane protein